MTTTADSLLDETLEYLSRLPRVPATQELINRIKSYKERPINTIEAIEVQENDSRIAEEITHHGLMVIQAVINGNSIYLKTADADTVAHLPNPKMHLRALEKYSTKILSKGITLELRPKAKSWSRALNLLHPRS